MVNKADQKSLLTGEVKNKMPGIVINPQGMKHSGSGEIFSLMV
jgi:hypothetical protein